MRGDHLPRLYLCAIMLTAFLVNGSCSCPDFNPARLSGLARLRHLELEVIGFSSFSIPQSWVQLQHLDLSFNALTQLPSDISVLTSLQHLRLTTQNAADFHLTQPLDFLTGLHAITHCQHSSSWPSVEWCQPLSSHAGADAFQQHAGMQDQAGGLITCRRQCVAVQYNNQIDQISAFQRSSDSCLLTALFA